MNAHTADRIPISTPISVSIGGRTYVGGLRNISSTGVFLHTMEKLTPGTTAYLRFTLPGENRVFNAEGTVKWTTASDKVKSYFTGSGIVFTTITPEDRILIEKFVTSWAKRVGLDG
ncbi:MAG: PilZ domain-containing protein [Thermodesulfobacteriota bacterium]